MPVDHRTDPEFHGPIPKPKVPRKNGYLDRFLALAAMIFLAWAAIGLIFPPNRCTNWPTTRRVQCTNNMRQVALALQSYHGKYGSFPPSYTTDDQGRPLHSWRTLILPFLDSQEMQALYDSIDLTKPWSDPANSEAFEKCVPTYHCTESQEPPNTTTYLAISAPGGWCLPGRPRRLEEFTDGAANTLLVIEVGRKSAVPWMAPVDADEALIMGIGAMSKTNHPSGFNSGGFNAAFADASTRFLKNSLPSETRRALLTIGGDETIRIDAD